MEFITNAQTKALNDKATLFANEQSKAKGYFPKRHFKRQDIMKMIQNKKKVGPTLVSVIKAASIIKQHDAKKNYKKTITKDEFLALDTYIKNTLGMDSWGLATFSESEILLGTGIPYKNVIVLSRHMDNDTFVVKELPNMDCMIEVMKVYGDTGVASLKTTGFLREMGFGAVPNHSLGGNIDYTKAGYKANLGFIGKHGMLITDHSGSCNRLSVVYTSIENLGEFLQNNEDYSWGKDFCAQCKKCVRSCPHDAIYEDAKIDTHGHVECISNAKCNNGFAQYGCAICIAACPFTKANYATIKERFLRK